MLPASSATDEQAASTIRFLLLIRVRDLIDTPSKWEGRSLLDAIGDVCRDGSDGMYWNDLWGALYEQRPKLAVGGLAVFNNSTCSHADVLALVDRAIETCS